MLGNEMFSGSLHQCVAAYTIHLFQPALAEFCGWHAACIGSSTHRRRISMLKESSTLPDAAADCLDALMHLSLLAVSSGYADIAKRAQLAISELLDSPESGCIVPAEYLSLRARPAGN